MHTELYSVSKIFTECLFRIPDYQRGYAWTQRQLKDFWADLEQLEEGKNHYTGVLTLEEVSRRVYGRWDDDLWIVDAKKFTPYHVVDGQQRLTTIVIFLQALMERLPDGELVNYTSRDDIRKKFIYESRDGGISRSYIFGYERDNPSYEFLKTRIFLEKSDRHSTLEETVYTHNLTDAKSFFAERLRDLGVAQLEALYTRVTQNFLFNIYTISEGIDVFVAFETMNNRGKALSQLELLKNRLIFLSTKLPGEASERTQLRTVINECWKTVYHYLGKNTKRPLDDDVFLHLHFVFYFGPGILQKKNDDQKSGVRPARVFRRSDYFKDYLLDEVFTTRNLLSSASESGGFSLSLNSTYEYAHNVKHFVHLYYQLATPADSDFSDAERIILEKLNKLKNYEATLLIIALFWKGRSETESARVRMLEVLERILFLNTLTYLRALEDFNLDGLALDLYTGKTDIRVAAERLEKFFAIALKDLDLNTVMLQWTKADGYYGWRGVRYFLFEYEQHLRTLGKAAREKLTWEEFSREKYEADYQTVEHIYPQTVVDECWKVRFRSCSIKQRNLLKHSIGNLVPLSKPKNSSLRNKCFEEKKGSVENQVGYSFGCLSENELALYADWTPKEILERGLKLLSFMEHRWGIPLGSREDRIKTLGLGFVERLGLDEGTTEE